MFITHQRKNYADLLIHLEALFFAVVLNLQSYLVGAKRDFRAHLTMTPWGVLGGDFCPHDRLKVLPDELCHPSKYRLRMIAVRRMATIREHASLHWA